MYENAWCQHPQYGRFCGQSNVITLPGWWIDLGISAVNHTFFSVVSGSLTVNIKETTLMVTRTA